MTEEVKRFGGRERPKVKKFTLSTYCDDGTYNEHHFQLVPIVPAGNVTALMDALQEAPEKSFGLMAKLLSQMLDNTDGVPAQWAVHEFPDPAPGDKGYKADDEQVYFIAPDNEPHPIADRDKFEDITQGSSRRRWVHLMDPAYEDESVDLGDMVDIAKWVVSEAVDRPTQARGSSTKVSRKTKR